MCEAGVSRFLVALGAVPALGRSFHCGKDHTHKLCAGLLEIKPGKQPEVVFRKESYSPEEFADLLEDLPALYITHSFIALRGGFVPHMATFSR